MSNARPPRLPRRALHGVLLLDKPIGWTSNDALQKTKGLLRAEKGGHTGTLDPLATGLLPLCFGAATKFSQASLDADKRYTATLHLGRTTSTGDLEGEVVEERPVDCDRAAIDAVLARFTGEIDQLPPMHSALKHQGRALYEYARQGVEVEREPRRVTIRSLAVLDWNSPTLVLDVECSKGTYVRTLAEDIGRALGCGAHLSALRRTASGALSLQGAVTIAELEAMAPEARAALLHPVDCLVADWPAVRLDEEDAGRFLSGQRRRIQHADAAAVRVYGPDPRAFLGSAHVTRGELIADRLLSPPEVASQLGAPVPLTSATPAEAEA
ncbi:tRNA pseudouridine(55) synthase TruB [Rubrivivax gelatinosus]|uniref:tRNA pseudouridine synthase B n=1 Tax=Rubrivivax gelatinosus (strain NBRC 100245 / IL144) TaxID=983917 RepID=I0HT24_RUBGI|nr:tRNA pseudouridine(55) synthase TruB [Rubrivivax gelatinosus]BAL96161.1 tRNA pseudouridine synthase B [Rubrivivax gelatinosus IL144]